MSKVKIKQIKKAVGDVDLSGMFEEMMGIKDAETEIIIPKFVSVRNTVRHICRVLKQFSTFAILRNDFPEISAGLDDVKKFVDETVETTYLKHDHDEKETQYANVGKEDINNLYRKLKENMCVKRLVILCSVLDKYKINFNDPAKLRENFVNQEPGLSFKVFDFSCLDLKILWANPKLNTIVKRYILSVLASLYKHTLALYNTITSPDVDIEKFTKLLLSSIGELRKQPELHRCKLAFERIEKSVELLKGNFSNYYRESIKSRNPDSLVTSFISDVANQGGANARLTREFRQIIQYMHKISQKSGRSKDPQVQKIFAMLNSNFSLMEKHTKGKKSDDTKDKPIIDPVTGLVISGDVPDSAVSVDPTDLGAVEDLLIETNAVPDIDPSEVADEKKTKRLEKQRAKKKKRIAMKKQAISDKIDSTMAATDVVADVAADADDLKDSTNATVEDATVEDVEDVEDVIIASETNTSAIVEEPTEEPVDELESLILK